MPCIQLKFVFKPSIYLLPLNSQLMQPLLQGILYCGWLVKSIKYSTGIHFGYAPVMCPNYFEIISIYFHLVLGVTMLKCIFATPYKSKGQVGEMPEWPKGTVC